MEVVVVEEGERDEGLDGLGRMEAGATEWMYLGPLESAR